VVGSIDSFTRWVSLNICVCKSHYVVFANSRFFLNAIFVAKGIIIKTINSRKFVICISQ